MDGSDLLHEFRDRHAAHLVYEGPYRLGAWRRLERELTLVLDLFDDWRQRIYRFENRYGASVVLYQPIDARSMRWDLVVTEFEGEDPFAFRYADAIKANLAWPAVQRVLDRIKAR